MGDGKQGFKSDRVIYGSHQLQVLMSILFNVMLSHGHNANYLIYFIYFINF